MKLIILVLSLVAFAAAQRGSYAGSAPIGRPGLASRFRDEDDGTSSTVNLNNRIGEGGSTQKIPIDARGDHDLVDRYNNWPRENRPFWLLNYEHIEAQRNAAPQLGNANGFQTINGIQTQSRFGEDAVIPARPAVPRPSFAGRGF